MPTLTLELLQQEIDYAVANNDWQGAFEAYNIVSGWLVREELVKNNLSEYNKYLNYLMKLKFLALNYFDDVQEYYELLKNYFPLSQEISDFDLWSKLEIQLVSMADVNKRDIFKAKLREALEKSESLLIPRQKYDNLEIPNKVSEWIKDFVVNLGLDSFDKLKKVEYLEHGKYTHILKDEDKNKIKNLLDIYEKLKFSSKTPEGYENVVVMNIDGKNIIFNHGGVEEISKESLKEIKNLATDFQPGDSLSINRTESAPASAPKPSAEAENPLLSLEQTLKNYPAGTLEHKAISQEISRLKVLELKAAQKSDAKK